MGLVMGGARTSEACQASTQCILKRPPQAIFELCLPLTKTALSPSPFSLLLASVAVSPSPACRRSLSPVSPSCLPNHETPVSPFLPFISLYYCRTRSQRSGGE